MSPGEAAGVGARAARWAPAASVGVLALAASATGITNGFAYDDVPIIVENAGVHDLHHLAHLFAAPYWPPQFGGTLYRPVTSTLFALEWAAGRGSPLPFHIVNVVLYVAVAVAAYALAARLVPPRAAWLAGALFAAHPVHVEAVANVVGQSELLAALIVVGAVLLYLARRAAAPALPLAGRDVVMLGATYAVGCLVKEHVIVLPAILLAAEATVVADSRDWRARARSQWPLAAVCVVVAAACFAARIAVLPGAIGDAPTIPFRHATWLTRWWTMLGVVPEWVRLLAWPAHLAAAYSPPAIAVREHLDVVSLLGLFVLAAAGGLAFVARRRLPVATFGIAWMALTLLPVSNVVVRSGVLLAERSLFLPSLGAALLFAAGTEIVIGWLRRAGPVLPRVAAAAACALVLAAVWRSAIRQPVWRDDATLFAQSVIDEPLSYTAHFAYAEWMFLTGKWGTGEQEARIALHLYDNDPRLFGRLGTQYFIAGQCQLAEPLLRRAIALAPHYGEPRAALARCLERDQDWPGLRSVALAGIAQNVNAEYYRSLLQQTDSATR